MVVVRIYLAVPRVRFAETRELLRGRLCDVHVLDDPPFRVSGREAAILAVVRQKSSRHAARERHHEIAWELREAGIPYRLLAVDAAAQPRADSRTWHVLRDPSTVGSFRREVTQIFRIPTNRKTARVLGPLLLGTGSLVTGRDQTEAERHRVALHAARGEPDSKSWIMEQLDNPKGGVQIGGSSGSRGWQIVIWAVVLLADVVLAGFEIFGTVKSLLAVVLVVVLWLVLVGMAIVIQMTHPPLRPMGRLRAATGIVYLAFSGAFVALSAVYLGRQYSGRAALFVVALAICAASVGLSFQMRSWGVGRLLPWITPLGTAAAATFTPALGYLSYVLYLDRIGVPYDALEFTTWENAIAGLKYMVLWITAVAVVVGGVGLLQWALGPYAPGTLIALLVTLVTLLLPISLILSDVLSAADHRSSLGEPSPWFAVVPIRACISSPPQGTPVFGGPFDSSKPTFVLGRADNRWLVWSATNKYWQFPVDTVHVTPIEDAEAKCPMPQ
jgi:hypothetical protein